MHYLNKMALSIQWSIMQALKITLETIFDHIGIVSTIKREIGQILTDLFIIWYL